MTYQGVVRLVGTVTAEGKAEKLVVVSKVDAALKESVIKTVQRWRFHTGIGENGRPLAVRMPIEVTFYHP